MAHAAHREPAEPRATHAPPPHASPSSGPGEQEPRAATPESQETKETVAARLRAWPKATVATAAGAALLASLWVGVGEVALAGAAGYLAYRWLRRDGRLRPER